MIYAILLFDTEINLGISTQPMRWHLTETIMYDDGPKALHDYIFPQIGWEGLERRLITATDDKEFEEEKNWAINDVNNPTKDSIEDLNMA